MRVVVEVVVALLAAAALADSEREQDLAFPLARITPLPLAVGGTAAFTIQARPQVDQIPYLAPSPLPAVAEARII